MKLSIFILTILFISSCFDDTKKTHNTKEEFTQIVDEILRFRFSEASVVQDVTMPILKMEDFQLVGKDSVILTPPPPTLPRVYMEFFDLLVEMNLLDSMDAKNIYLNIDTTKTIFLEADQLSKPLISKKALDSLFNVHGTDEAYDLLGKKYGTSCFIKIGTPLFNLKFSKLILAVDIYCGGTNGGGYILVLKKTNEKWKIIGEFGTWVS